MKPEFVFWGSSDFSVLILEELLSHGSKPVLVVTTPDKAQGRKMLVQPNVVKTWAEKNNIPCLTPERLKEPEFLKKIETYKIHFVASYGRIISKEVLDLPEVKLINIHPSLLPKYRGASPLQAQILADEKNIGVSLILIDTEMDHGSLLAQQKVEINNWPVSFGELAGILGRAGTEMFLNLLPGLTQGKFEAREQNHTAATYTEKFDKKDGELDLVSGDAWQNYLKIRAFSVSPQTYFFIEKNDAKIRVVIKDAKYENGKLIILRVTPEGRKEMDYVDFLRGLK